jgi:hypothetical protein
MGSKEDVQPKEKSSDGKLYRVQVEAFAERGNGERLAEELKKKRISDNHCLTIKKTFSLSTWWFAQNIELKYPGYSRCESPDEVTS